MQLRADNPFGMIVGFSSYATEDQLKAAWMLMEWMIQPDVLFVLENGIEGVTYTIGEDGLPVVDGEYRGEEMLNHNMNIDMTCLVHASKEIGTIEQSIAAITPQGLPQDFYPMLLQNYNEVLELSLIHIFAAHPPRRTLKINWFGSEEQGLLGSKAWTAAHADELDKHLLMINLDVAGATLGQNSAPVLATPAATAYVDGLMREMGTACLVKSDIYSSDRSPFADHGVPAVNLLSLIHI